MSGSAMKRTHAPGFFSTLVLWATLAVAGCPGTPAPGDAGEIPDGNSGCTPACGLHSSCNPSGACVCDPGWGDCNGAPGCEADLTSDPANCGQCGLSCGPRESCASSTCACNPGFGDCDGTVSNGCEADLTSDPANCSACGSACPAGAVCVSSTCGCAPGLGDCDGTVSNGCETDLTSDPMHCAAC